MQQQGRGPLAITDEQVIEETYRKSEDWYVLLDAWGAPARSHAEIVEHLESIYRLDENWANTLAVRYEYARELQREMSVPGDLIAAMILKPQARESFERLSAPEQRAIVDRVESSSDAPVRRERINEIIEKLT